MMENNNNQGILSALGYGALPQGIVGPLTTTQKQVQTMRYDPNRAQALVDALKTPQQMQKGNWELLGNALANNITSPQYEGAYGVKFADPRLSAIATGVNLFNDIYGTQKQQERDAANAQRENEIKVAQLLLDDGKQTITDKTDTQYMKVNQTANGMGTPDQQQLQRQAALDALHELDDLARNGGINSLNKATDNWMLSSDSSKNIGRREQALSALIPMTNAVARASGGSGINTLGEMMAYLGIPENATSAQIEGALPGMIKKLGLDGEYYQMSPVNGGMAF